MYRATRFVQHGKDTAHDACAGVLLSPACRIFVRKPSTSSSTLTMRESIPLPERQNSVTTQLLRSATLLQDDRPRQASCQDNWTRCNSHAQPRSGCTSSLCSLCCPVDGSATVRWRAAIHWCASATAPVLQMSGAWRRCCAWANMIQNTLDSRCS